MADEQRHWRIDKQYSLLLSFKHHPYRFAGRAETALRGGLCLCMESSN